jgi:hypothetical protein
MSALVRATGLPRCGFTGAGAFHYNVASTVGPLRHFSVIRQDLSDAVATSSGLAHRAILPLFSGVWSPNGDKPEYPVPHAEHAVTEITQLPTYRGSRGLRSNPASRTTFLQLINGWGGTMRCGARQNGNRLRAVPFIKRSFCFEKFTPGHALKRS